MSRIVIVGAGILGLSVARAARRRNHEVLVLEAGPLPNPHAASYDQHRMIRYHYGDAEGYTRMVGGAFAAWDGVWADLGVRHFADSGAISISLASDDYSDRSLAVFRRLGIPHEVLDRDAVERLCPHLELPDRSWGLVARPGGPLFADRILRDSAMLLESQGVILRPRCPVATVDLDAGTVTTQAGEAIAGDLVVIAVGAWLPALMPQAFGTLPTFRQALCYAAPPARYRDAWRDGPAIVSIGDRGTYTLPPLRGAGLKLGAGAHRRPASVREGFGSNISEGRQVIDCFRPFLRDADAYEPERIQVGYYVMDKTRRFRLERSRRAIVITNCDGQMFKFGPLIGERIVDAFDGRLSFADLARWCAGH